ncbi:hypothetical protein [Lusitaniella coriacea]|uniref:hypothetical protein n=1 Tax=Lusitaniella coriacea TaxID=1983105 RepID=UPI003CEA24E8
MSEDGLLGNILNAISGNLATDLTKALARKTGNTRIALTIRDKLGLDKEHPAALDLFSEVVSRTHSQVNVSKGTLEKFLRSHLNRELIFEFIISPLEESLISSSDPEKLISIFDIQEMDLRQKSDLMRFLPVLHQQIYRVRQKAFSPETQTILYLLKEIEKQIQLLKSANKPSLSPSLLDVIEPSKQRAKRQDIVYKAPFILIALLQDEYSIAKKCFDECQEGLANQIIEICERWIQKQEEKQGSDRDSFIEFQWKDLENVKLAESFAQADKSQEVLKKHLLLGTLCMESSSIMRNLKRSLLENDFEQLLHLIENKPLQQWTRRKSTPDADMF